MTELDAAIRNALASLTDGNNLPQAASQLFAALGYRSTRVLAGQSGRVEDFIAQFPADRQTESENRLRDNATAIHILFQVTDEEIKEELSYSGQGILIENFDKGLSKSYLFLAVELNQSGASRKQYAEFTREINKRFSMPAFLLFRAEGGLVTLAFVPRRRHRRNNRRHVLEKKVSLICNINPANPHLEILAELSLPRRLDWMRSHNKPFNFDGLLAALLDSLDTQEHTQRVYKDLFGWGSIAPWTPKT